MVVFVYCVFYYVCVRPCSGVDVYRLLDVRLWTIQAIATLTRNWVSRSQTRSTDSKELLFPKLLTFYTVRRNKQVLTVWYGHQSPEINTDHGRHTALRCHISLQVEFNYYNSYSILVKVLQISIVMVQGIYIDSRSFKIFKKHHDSLDRNVIQVLGRPPQDNVFIDSK